MVRRRRRTSMHRSTRPSSTRARRSKSLGDVVKPRRGGSQTSTEYTVAKIPSGVGPRFPQVVVLVGATGDLARRKLIPGLLHLSVAGFIPGLRLIGVSLDDLD